TTFSPLSAFSTEFALTPILTRNSRSPTSSDPVHHRLDESFRMIDALGEINRNLDPYPLFVEREAELCKPTPVKRPEFLIFGSEPPGSQESVVLMQQFFYPPIKLSPREILVPVVQAVADRRR